MIAIWHGHHNVLISWLDSIEARMAEIKANKPKHEQATRLRLIKAVIGALPPKLKTAWQAYETARQAYETARQAYETAWQAYETARQAYKTARQAYETARQAYETARQAYKTAWQAYETARQAYENLYAKYLPEVKALHAKECVPDCPWDGKTIFPVRREGKS